MEVKSKDFFPQIFSRHAAAYKQRLDEIMARGEAVGRQRVIDALDVEPGMRVLDLACGPATLSKPLAALVAPDGEVVGVDLAAGMIELARSMQIPNARFEVMDLERLEFPDAAFDAVGCGHGLHFVSDLDRALGEARRVIRPEGRFAASVPVDDGRQAWGALDQVVDRWLPPAPQPEDHKATRSTVGDVEAFRSALLNAGFSRADVEVVEEKVVWPSAEQLVMRAMDWWDFASRVEGLDPGKRQGFIDDAVAAVRKQHPGPIETFARNHVATAIA